jgi:adenosyl cobinamide kinase/adenosyl cobinamide phosphate guanylyltransferase
MILVVGGAHQGKSEYVKENFGSGYTIIHQYHLKVKEQLENGKNPVTEAEKLLSEEEKQGKELIIISDELGYGLVPVDAFEREYREQNGRVNCCFAKHAGQVIRVICGIGTKIKG